MHFGVKLTLMEITANSTERRDVGGRGLGWTQRAYATHWIRLKKIVAKSCNSSNSNNYFIHANACRVQHASSHLSCAHLRPSSCSNTNTQAHKHTYTVAYWRGHPVRLALALAMATAINTKSVRHLLFQIQLTILMHLPPLSFFSLSFARLLSLCCSLALL